MTRPLEVHPICDQSDLAEALGDRRPRSEVLADWLQAQPLLAPAAGLVLGILAEAWCDLPPAFPLLLLFIAGSVILTGRRRPGLIPAGLLLAASAVGAVRYDLAVRRWPPDHIVRFVPEGGCEVTLRAVVCEPPRLVAPDTGSITWIREDPRTKMRVRAREVETSGGRGQVSGTIAVTVGEPALHVGLGDEVRLSGRLYHPRPPDNPAAIDFALRARREGIPVHMFCRHALNVQVQPGGDPVRQGWGGYRRWARQAMLRGTYRGEETGADLLASMVLGERSAVQPELNDVFAATGVIHYLSVSGAHVAALAGAVWLAGWMIGLARRDVALVGIGVIVGYCLLAEPRAPILRAGLIGVLMCLAVLLRRRVRSVNWLALAILLLGLWDPCQVFELDFQLSFVCVASLLFLAPRLVVLANGVYWWWRGGYDPLLSREVQDRLSPPGPWRRWLRRAGDAAGLTLAFTFAATLAGFPLASWYFYRLCPWGWLNNLLVTPLMWIVQMVGLLKTLLAVLWPGLADRLGAPLAGCTDLLIAQVRLLAQLPGAWASVPAMPPWLTALFYGLLVLWLAAPRLRIPSRAVAVAAAVWVLLAAWRLAPPPADGVLRLDLLAVGNGTCCVIRLPDGRHLLYDAGTVPPGNLERWTLGPYLARGGITRLEAAVISHADLDHFSGLPDVARRFTVRQVIAPPQFQTVRDSKRAVAALMDALRAMGVPWKTVQAGDRLTGTGEVDVEVLWPAADTPADWKINDTSLVLRLRYAGVSILLCGDIEDTAQEHLRKTTDLRADVLLLPHHGSVTAATPRFIAAVDPRYCLRSSGRETPAMPTPLSEAVAGRKYYNTADVGAVTVEVSARGVVVRPFLAQSAGG